MIVSAFLALEEGYEILPTMEGRSKELILIPMPPNGFRKFEWPIFRRQFDDEDLIRK